MNPIPQGYKQTEIGVIPEDWEALKFGDVCTLINGRGFKPYEWTIEGLPIIRIQNLNGSEEFNYYQGHYDPKIFVQNGQLLFAWSGSRGTSFGPHIWHGGDALLNYHTWKLVIKNESIDEGYFFHILKLLTKQIEDSAHGASALVHTQKGEMENFFIPFPKSQQEQTAIATALSDVDALITGLESLIAKKQAIKTATMQQLLTGKTRLPQFAHHPDGTPKGTQQTELGEIPEDWGVSTIRNFAPLQRGFDLPCYQRKNGNFPVVYSNGIVNHHSDFQVQGEGVVTGRSGTIGKVHYINSSFWPHNTTLWVTSFENSVAKYVYYLFLTIGFERFSSGSGVPTLNRNDVHDFKIAVPPKPEQTAIAQILSDMDEEIQTLQTCLSKTQQIKQGMMQELLTGKVRLVQKPKEVIYE